MISDSDVWGTPSKNLMTIYHGSVREVREPKFGKGKVYNDYGVGFYCTEVKKEAEMWAVSSHEYLPEGYCNQYSLDLTGLKVLRIDKSDVLTWIALLLKNRVPSGVSPMSEYRRDLFVKQNLKFNVSDYDVVIGYRADDSYFSFALAFLDVGLTYEYLGLVLSLGNLGEQVVLVSEKSFDNLKFTKSEFITSSSLRKEYFDRDKIARSTFKDFATRSVYSRGKTIMDFIKEDI